MVATDNWNQLPGAVRVWSFGQPLPGVPPQGALVYRTTDWALDIGHISHANARPGVPLDQQFACGGQASRSSLPRANEIVCFRLDTSLRVLVVAPMMTDLNAAGGGDSDYAKLPKGNLDITGQYFIWTSNAGTNRLDAFVVKVPSQLLVSSGGSTPPTGTAPSCRSARPLPATPCRPPSSSPPAHPTIAASPGFSSRSTGRTSGPDHGTALLHDLEHRRHVQWRPHPDRGRPQHRRHHHHLGRRPGHRDQRARQAGRHLDQSRQCRRHGLVHHEDGWLQWLPRRRRSVPADDPG